MCRIFSHEKDTRYPLDPEVTCLCEVPYQKVMNTTKAYEDIRGTYDALFDELGSLGHWKPLMEQVKYLGLPLELVEEYIGCLPEDVEDLKFFDYDEAHEAFGLWNNRRRLLTFIPIYLLDRVRYLAKINESDAPECNNLNFLYSECKRYLAQIESMVTGVASGENNIAAGTSMHLGIYPTCVVFDAYSFKDNGELHDMSVSIPLNIYDMLRNDDLIGFHVGFLNYEFGVDTIRDLYEAMENIIIMTAKEE